MTETIKVLAGDDMHLTLLMVPYSLNLVTGADRQTLLSFGSSAFESGYQAACVDKDTEITALKAQLASLARGVKISIPTETMEQEFQQHYRRGFNAAMAQVVQPSMMDVGRRVMAEHRDVLVALHNNALP